MIYRGQVEQRKGEAKQIGKVKNTTMIMGRDKAESRGVNIINEVGPDVWHTLEAVASYSSSHAKHMASLQLLKRGWS